MKIKKNKRKEANPLVPRSEKLLLKQEGLSPAQATAPHIAAQSVAEETSSHSSRDIPDGMKPEIRKKTRRLKNQAVVQRVGSSDILMPDQKISQPEEKNSESGKYFYVYGITNDNIPELNFKGLNDQPIQKFEIKDLAVLFSFYPTLHPMIEEKEALLHAEILNKLADKITVVPMAFGTVFKDQEILKTILIKSYQPIKNTLRLIKDKFELGVKVVKKESEEIQKNAGQEIVEELKKLSVQNVQGDKFSDRLLLNNSFLVEKNKFTSFSDKVGELEEKYPNLKIIYTGPWPAYSFVNININVG